MTVGLYRDVGGTDNITTMSHICIVNSCIEAFYAFVRPLRIPLLSLQMVFPGELQVPQPAKRSMVPKDGLDFKGRTTVHLGHTS